MGKRVRDDGLIEYSGLYWRLALPQVVIPVMLSVIAGLLVWASRRPGSGWPSLGLGPALGLTIWTLFEYGFSTRFWARRFGTYQPLTMARPERG